MEKLSIEEAERIYIENLSPTEKLDDFFPLWRTKKCIPKYDSPLDCYKKIIDIFYQKSLTSDKVKHNVYNNFFLAFSSLFNENGSPNYEKLFNDWEITTLVLIDGVLLEWSNVIRLRTPKIGVTSKRNIKEMEEVIIPCLLCLREMCYNELMKKEKNRTLLK